MVVLRYLEIKFRAFRNSTFTNSFKKKKDYFEEHAVAFFLSKKFKERNTYFLIICPRLRPFFIRQCSSRSLPDIYLESDPSFLICLHTCSKTLTVIKSSRPILLAPILRISVCTYVYMHTFPRVYQCYRNITAVRSRTTAVDSVRPCRNDKMFSHALRKQVQRQDTTIVVKKRKDA